ncbi:MAG: PASTA domain-containing protein [Deltaproteobacteria bacterium]|nr:PASTA domain-containing protein [Deltaproteobacteria bacterium]
MFAGAEPLLKITRLFRVLWILLWLLLFCSSLQAADYGFTLDFEEGNLRGWTVSGQAFDNQPTLDDNPTARGRGQSARQEGRYWIGTYENFQGKRGQKAGTVQGDGPIGALTSKRFTIPQGTLSFLVGGGSDTQRLGVEFWVKTRQTQEFDSDRVYQAAGQNSERMRRVTWDLTPFAGKTGFINIVDNSSAGWGHINVDDFRFTPKSSRLEAAQPPIDTAERRPPAERARVPSLINHQIEEAEELLNAASLTLGRLDKRESDHRPGTVLEQAPRAGTLLPLKTAVDVTVATPVYVTMPKLIGKDIAIAEEIINTQRLRLGSIKETPSPEKAGIVLGQRPPAGKRVVANTEVDLAVARPEWVRVPTLIGEEPGKAEEMLMAGRLAPGSVQTQEAPRETVVVISQDPAAGTRVPAGSQVNFVIATPAMIMVPNLIGLDLNRAEGILEKAGLRKGDVTKRTVARPAGTVVEQNPPSGVKAPYNSAVRVAVAEGLPPAIMPDLIGLPLKKALATLQKLNLPTGDISRKGSDRPVDTVLGQKPGPGAAVEVGTIVNLSVAREKKDDALIWGIFGAVMTGIGVAGGLWLRGRKNRPVPKPRADFSVTPRTDPGHRTLLAEGSLFKRDGLRIRTLGDDGKHTLIREAKDLFQKPQKE